MGSLRLIDTQGEIQKLNEEDNEFKNQVIKLDSERI